MRPSVKHKYLLKRWNYHGVFILAAAVAVASLGTVFAYWAPFRVGETLAKDGVLQTFEQKMYDEQCQWTYNEDEGGYPPVANEGRHHLAQYVCAATFRDLSDYVYSWPYHRFSEYDVWVADVELAANNLPPVGEL